MNKLLLSIVTSIMLLTAASSYGETPQANEIVVVDFQKIFMESSAGKDLTTKLEAQKVTFEDTRNKKEAELIKINEDLKKQQSVLSGEAFEKKKKDFEEKVQAFQQDLQNEGAKFEKMRNTAMEKIETATKEVITDLAKEKNFKLVVSQNVVLYAIDSINFSDEVLKRLDKKLKTVDLK